MAYTIIGLQDDTSLRDLVDKQMESTGVVCVSMYRRRGLLMEGKFRLGSYPPVFSCLVGPLYWG
jgi:hypothetical protein